MTTQNLFLQCGKCEARWLALQTPCSADHFVAVLKAARCPYCLSKKTYLCNNQGPHAVTEPREPQKAPKP